MAKSKFDVEAFDYSGLELKLTDLDDAPVGLVKQAALKFPSVNNITSKGTSFVDITELQQTLLWLKLRSEGMTLDDVDLVPLKTLMSIKLNTEKE